MDIIAQTLNRMDMPKIRSFLLYGSEEYDENVQPYMETLQKCSDPIQRRLEAIYPDGTELDCATGELNDALMAYQNIYMEIGMKAGARLVCQLLVADHAAQDGGGA